MRTVFVISASFFIVSCCFLRVCSGFTAESRTNWATEAYKKGSESVVFIEGNKIEERRGHSADSDRSFNGMGSGIIIDERGYIITNYHVVKDIRQIHVKTYDETEYIAALIAQDAETDLALIKINVRTPLRPITFGRSHDLMPGEVCMAIGNPYGYLFSLTDGRISAINREVGVNDSSLVYRLAVQTNTEINPGNSGGPLFNVYGEMIGINVAIRQGATGIAFATPVDQVVEVAAKLMGEIVNQQIAHGITVSQIEPKDYDSIKRFIVRVESVENNSPAALSGIQRGDILEGVGKYTIRNKLDFYRALLDTKANEDLAFSLFRNNELIDVPVALGSPKGGRLVNRTVSPQPAAATPKAPTAGNSVSDGERDRFVWENLGIRYVPMPAQEFARTHRDFLTQFDGGIVVKAVREGSPADQVGILDGDLIVGIGPWSMTSANDIRFLAWQEWKKLQADNETLQADVIRDNTHYRAEIPMQ